MANFLDFKGKAAIVTGASAGIGEAIAYEFARQGSHLMICGRNQGRLEKVQQQCQVEGGSGVKVEICVGDITDDDFQNKCIESTVKAFGQLNVLINNAGCLTTGDPDTTTRRDYDTTMDTNMKSIFFLTQLAIPHLKKTKGSIVNVSSVGASFGIPRFIVYAMSKSALEYYTKTMALHLGPDGVRVNAVSPGAVDTLIFTREIMDDKEYTEFLKKQSASYPLGRIGTTSEIADVVLYLASERASFVTGTVVFADGGLHNCGPQPTS